MVGLTGSASFDTVLEDIVVPAKIAAPAGIILTELVTNALKYGLPEDGAGNITITLTKTAGGAALEVRDNGARSSLGGPRLGVFRNRPHFGESPRRADKRRLHGGRRRRRDQVQG